MLELTSGVDKSGLVVDCSFRIGVPVVNLFLYLHSVLLIFFDILWYGIFFSRLQLSR